MYSGNTSKYNVASLEQGITSFEGTAQGGASVVFSLWKSRPTEQSNNCPLGQLKECLSKYGIPSE
jgi:hypothetical protein